MSWVSNEVMKWSLGTHELGSHEVMKWSLGTHELGIP